MSRTAGKPAPPAPPRQGRAEPEKTVPRWLAGALLALAALVAYANTFTAPFIFDDRHSVVENATIRDFSTALVPPADAGAGVRGRPLINLSLALNYAVGGLDVRGYHAANLLIHVAAALTLYGLVRRTLRRPRLREAFGAAAQPLALTVALWWMVHPLLTESVTCVVQRTETLASLFYLLTLYAFCRATEPGGSQRWLLVSVGACLVGVTAKEILVTAPVLVLLYDGTWVSTGVGEAWRQRRGYYLALAATWLPLSVLVLSAQGRGGTVGFGHDISAWDYALTQCAALVRYLRLSIVPYPLVLDYGTGVVRNLAAVWPQALLVISLLVAIGVGLWRRTTAGFVGAAFFVILAPSSSVIPLTTQTIAEHRMYLPLAALGVLVVAALYRWLGRWSLPLVWTWSAALLVGTVLRNADYRSEVAIWDDTVRHAPDNARAHYNLAVALLALERNDEAELELREAIRRAPNYTDALVNLGQLLVRTGRPAEAVPPLEAALWLRPESFPVQLNLATALEATDRRPEALAHYQAAVRLQPASGLAQFGLGSTLATTGQFGQALAPLEAAARLQPAALTESSLASVLAALGRRTEATAHFEAALRLQPDSPETHFNFGLLLAHHGDLARAQQEWERALVLRPDYAEARLSLERIRGRARR